MTTQNGETANDYVFVKTRSQEIDYPAGDENVYTTYQGRGGVPVKSVWRRLLLALRFSSYRILLSPEIGPESRVMYHRQVAERVRRIAPFFRFDADPYLVIREDGTLVWIVDGYTATDRFPYAERVPPFGNYVRNAVKVVVDAYHGSVTFYQTDEQDPLIRAYGEALPELLKPLAEMPRDLRAHIRYPTGLFTVQARMYATYHMQDSRVFYNKEDLWSIPRRVDARQEREMEPYYTIMRLPGEAREEFVLLMLFTPFGRDNMIAWLAARSDGGQYGRLTAFLFPKQRLIFGPRQIAARIDQDAVISQQLSLWNQRGSAVIRGSLLAIPIEETLDASLQSIFGRRLPTIAMPAPDGSVPPNGPDRVRALVGRAWEAWTRAQDSLKRGDWTAYGEAQKGLEQALRALREGSAR